MLKNSYFLEKNCKKIASASGAGQTPGTLAVALAYYCIFVEFISCAICLLLP